MATRVDFPTFPMSDPLELAGTLGARTLDAVRQAQRATVQAVESWSGAVGRFVPDETRLQALLPDVPGPTELLDQVFDLSRDLLDAQHEFVRELLAAATPATPAPDDEA